MDGHDATFLRFDHENGTSMSGQTAQGVEKLGFRGIDVEKRTKIPDQTYALSH